VHQSQQPDSKVIENRLSESVIAKGRTGACVAEDHSYAPGHAPAWLLRVITGEDGPLPGEHDGVEENLRGAAISQSIAFVWGTSTAAGIAYECLVTQRNDPSIEL
jgi:hypothetical protein